MTVKDPKKLLPAAVIVLGFLLIYILSSFIEAHRPPLPEGFEDQDLALQGRRLKGFSLGFEGLIADWYWMNSLQYVGNKVHNAQGDSLNLDNLRPLNPRLLYPYLDNSTDLDPRFIPVYAYGAVVLPAINPDQAIQLCEKGIANNPDEWRLYQYLGYIYWRLGNYDKASEVYEKGSHLAGAPAFMSMMAAAMKTESGSRKTARAMYQQMFDDGKDNDSKNYASLRLLQLDSLDERDAIDSTLSNIMQRAGHCPANLNEIIPLLRQVRLPAEKNFHIDTSNNIVDPTGIPYHLDSDKCTASLGAGSKIPRD